MIKAKKYDWKDSNLALFGSDTEKKVKKESAESEPAWKGCGQSEGLQIWRIVKFKVEPWPKEEYGNFFDGDSYIILNTFKEEEELKYDVHFWIGKHSTQDEYGTAAYKTVEVDTFLDDKPIQHREVQGHESDLFKSYFDSLTTMSGGADSGFRRVTPEAYKPRLLHFCGSRRNVQVREVPLAKSRINSGDVYILDLGLRIFQFNGKESNKDERFKAMQYCNKIKSDRNGRAEVEVLEEEDTSEGHEFFGSLTGDDEDDLPSEAADKTKELFRLSDASGSTQFNLEKKGDMSEGDLDPKDVFILDTKESVFVWIGGQASIDERKNAMTYAHNYLMKSDHPLVPVTCVKMGQKSPAFNTAIAA